MKVHGAWLGDNTVFVRAGSLESAAPFCSERERCTLQSSMKSGHLQLLWPFRQGPVQYVQPAAAVALPSNHAPVRYAWPAPVVYGQPRPITSQVPVAHAWTVQHIPANFVPVAQAWTVAKPTAPAIHPSGYEEGSSAEYNRVTTGRVAACQSPSTMPVTRPPAPETVRCECHSGCSLDGTPDENKSFTTTCGIAASGSVAASPTPGSSRQFDDRVSTGRHPCRHQPKDSYVGERGAEQARCLDIEMPH